MTVYLLALHTYFEAFSRVLLQDERMISGNVQNLLLEENLDEEDTTGSMLAGEDFVYVGLKRSFRDMLFFKKFTLKAQI